VQAGQDGAFQGSFEGGKVEVCHSMSRHKDRSGKERKPWKRGGGSDAGKKKLRIKRVTEEGGNDGRWVGETASTHRKQLEVQNNG